MKIDMTELNELEPYKIVTHCLWEMTFFSFDEDETQQALHYLKEISEGLNKKHGDV